MKISDEQALQRVAEIRAAIPPGGMFADREFHFSPEPFPLDRATVRRLERLGDQLSRFQSACNDAYYRSRKGTLPQWISGILDKGKPGWLSAHVGQSENRSALPKVLRPDLILTDDGFALTELDSVPGGIGLTGHLAELYSRFEDIEIIGGADGMVEGFRSILPDGGDILVSEESGDYRPEMDWLAQQLGDGYEVLAAEGYGPNERAMYRFFELFDHASMPWLEGSLASGGSLSEITPPLKPHLEEKMWLAFFWSLPLREFWRRALRDANYQALKEVIPFGWPVDPTELPPHAALPKLEAQSWDEVAQFSQKDRELVLKISGFSELAWEAEGCRSGKICLNRIGPMRCGRRLARFRGTPT